VILKAKHLVFEDVNIGGQSLTTEIEQSV